jgi:hypothetical protein
MTAPRVPTSAAGGGGAPGGGGRAPQAEIYTHGAGDEARAQLTGQSD